MHVLHCIHSFLPVTENWVYSQLKFNTYCQSSVLCQYRQNEEQFPYDAVYPVHRKLTPLAQCALLLVRLRARYPNGPALRAIRDIKPDIIHAHFAWEAWRYREAFQESGIPFVTTFYGLDISKLPRRAVWKKRYAELFSHGSAFMVEGEFMAARLADLGCPADKINSIPIGVDIEGLRALPVMRNGKNTHVLFTGLNREKKGAVYAADAFAAVAAKHPEVRFDLVGGGKFRLPVQKRLQKAGLLDRCTFHGYVPVFRYRELLRGADIVLAPSVTAADGDTEGGAPVTVIEAQAAGVPVVGTLHCDIPMVVKHGDSGLLCNERDTMAMSANLERLVRDAELRRRMGEAAVKKAYQQHDIKKQVEKIYSVYVKCTRILK